MVLAFTANLGYTGRASGCDLGLLLHTRVASIWLVVCVWLSELERVLERSSDSLMSKEWMQITSKTARRVLVHLPSEGTQTDVEN